MTISSDDTVWITERLTATETLIANVEAAITAVLGGAQSYVYDSGANRVQVTRANLEEQMSLLKTLEERRSKLRSQLGLPNAVGSQIHLIPSDC